MENISKENKLKKPFILIKPSVSEKGPSVYLSLKEIYNPTKENVKKLIEFLNNFDPSKEFPEKTVEEKLSKVRNKLQRVKELTIEDAENKANYYNCNILGGVFLAFLESFGIKIGRRIGKVIINQNDIIFLQTLYPELTPYFLDKEKLSQNEIEYCTGVVISNTGSFIVIEVDEDISIIDNNLLLILAALKKVFRYAVKQNIPYNSANIKVRCNLIHTPETIEELINQWKVIESRLQLEND